MEYEALKKIIEKEIENLRKIFFRYRRRRFIEKNIWVEYMEIGDIKGLYKPIYIENDYIHMIIINKELIGDYKKNISALTETIRYELIRAFCKEYFEGNCEKFKDAYYEDSWILFSILQFAGFKTNDPLYMEYKKSHLYQIVNSTETFDELQLELLFYNIEDDNKFIINGD